MKLNIFAIAFFLGFSVHYAQRPVAPESTRWANGKPKDVYLLEGRKVRYILFGEEGEKLMEGFFRDTLREGKWIKYYPSQKIQSVLHYKKGEYHKVQTEYYPDGGIHKISTYKNGVLDGKYMEFYANGFLKFKGRYKLLPYGQDSLLSSLPPGYTMPPPPKKHSALIGKSEHYYETGELESVRYYAPFYQRIFEILPPPAELENPKPEDFIFSIRYGEIPAEKWLYYSPKGALIKTEEYENGRLIRVGPKNSPDN